MFCCNRTNRFTLVEVGDECGNKSTAGEKEAVEVEVGWRREKKTLPYFANL